MQAYICSHFVVELAGYFADVAHFAYMVCSKYIALSLFCNLISFYSFRRSTVHSLLCNFLKKHDEQTLVANIMS